MRNFGRIRSLSWSGDQQYPLILWQGQDGYHFNIPQIKPGSTTTSNKKVSCNDFYAYMLMIRRDNPNHLLQCRDLFHQFLVDMYAKVETERLIYLRTHQRQLRVESYIHLRDAVLNDGDTTNMGQLVILPSTYVGGPRYMHERTQDAMTYVRTYGRPDLFITFTCNPQWQEIKELLLPGQQSHQRHDLLARVFRQKVIKMLALITKHEIFGAVRCYMYTIEWQKRGLPHAHMLFWLKSKIRPTQIDSFITAEIPDQQEDPELFDIIKSNMIHGPCGDYHRETRSPCMVDGKCSKGYPKPFLAETETGDDGYPSYRRRKPGQGGFNTTIWVSHNRMLDIDQETAVSSQAEFRNVHQQISRSVPQGCWTLPSRALLFPWAALCRMFTCREQQEFVHLHTPERTHYKYCLPRSPSGLIFV